MAGRPGGVATSPTPGSFTGVATAAKSSGLLTVNVNGILRTVQAARDVTFAAGDVVVLHRFGALWLATARIGTAAVTEMPPIISDLDPNPAVITGSLTVLPTFTGTYRGSGWLTIPHVRQGIYGGEPNTIGTAFYGDKPRSLSGSTVTSARLEKIFWLRSSSSPAAMTLRLVTETAKPSGAPTLTSSTAGPSLSIGDDISFTIPNAFAQAMVDGTAGGLAFYDADGSPFVQVAGRDSHPTALTLVIDWSRTV